MNKYFNNLLPGGRVHTGDYVIDMRTIPAHALELYISGFKYLSLKPAAVELLSRKLTIEELNKLIDKHKGCKNDVKLIKQAINLKKSLTNKIPTRKKRASK